MDFILDFFDKIQKSTLFLIVQKLGIVDWVLIFAILGGMVWGSRRGLGKMLGEIVEILLVSILVLTFYPKLSAVMVGAVPALSETVASPISFVLLCIFIWLAIAWTFKVLGKLVKFELTGSFKSLGGLLCGVIYFFLLVSFFSQFLLLLPVSAIKAIYQPRNSYSGRIVGETVPAIQSFVISPFQKEIQGPKNPLAK